MANSDMLVRIKANTDNYNAGIASASRALNQFKQSNLTVGGAISQLTKSLTAAAAGYMSIASAGAAIANTVKESIALAKAGEGIRNAFERLNRPELLDGLRQATHGTVTDIELMKSAVKFNDFKLPLNELGTMLAFAQQKAKDTGQSVDYMVDSIVTGLGRKSLMILDNLGLSAAEIKEKMKESGDMTKAVGEIIREQMAKAGGYVETAAERALQANVSLQNKMEELGRKFAPVEEASNQLWVSMKLGILDIIGGPLATLLNQLTEAGRLRLTIDNIGGNGKVNRMIGNLSGAKEENRQSIYSRQVAEINRYINRRENYMKNRQRWVNNQGNEDLRQQLLTEQQAFGTNNVGEIQRQIKAAKIMLADYKKSAQGILNPSESKTNFTDLITKGGGGGKNTTDSSFAPDSIAAQQKRVQELTKQWQEASAELRNGYKKELDDAKRILADMQNPSQPIKKLYSEDYSKANMGEITGGIPGIGKGLDKLPEHLSPLQQMNKELARMKELLELSPDSTAYQAALEQIANKQKEIDEFTGVGNKTAKSWSEAARAINMVGSAIGGLQDPAAQIASTVAMAIANIAMAYSETLAKDASSKSNIWYFIATTAAAMVSMATTISSIHSATGYAEGGEIKGNSYSGDNIPIMANAGEVVLTKAMQGSLAQSLESPRGGGGFTASHVSGEQIWIALNAYTKRSGQGEIVTWR